MPHSAVSTLLASRNITATTASEASQQLLARFRALTSGAPAASCAALGEVSDLVEPLLAGASTVDAPFQVLCPPTCLNLGSFAPLLGLESSCICDLARLASLEEVARRGAALAGVALAGAAAMYCACTILLMVLTAHSVVAAYDR